MIRARSLVTLAVYFASALIVALSMTQTREQWVGSAPAFNGALNSTTVLLLPLCAAASGGVIAVARSSKVLTLLTSFRGGLARVGLRVVGTTGSAAVLGAASAALVMWRMFYRFGYFGNFVPLSWLVLVASIFLACFIGVGMGLLVPTLLAAPASGVGVYILLLVPSYYGFRKAQLLLPFDDRSMVYQYQLPEYYVLLSLLYGTLLIALYQLMLMRSRPIITTFSVGAGVLALVISNSFTTAGLKEASTAASPVCEGTISNRVCVTATRQSVLGTAQQYIDEARVPIQSTPFDPTGVFWQDAIDTKAPVDAHIFALAGKIALDSSLVDRDVFLANVGNEILLPRTVCNLESSAIPNGVVLVWYFSTLHASLRTTVPFAIQLQESSQFQTALTWFEALDSEDRTSWLQSHFGKYQACQLSIEDFKTA